MTIGTILIIALFIPPLLALCISMLPLKSKTMLQINTYAAAVECVVIGVFYWYKPLQTRLFAFGNNAFVDTLSLYHISMVGLIFLLSSIYSQHFFSADIKSGTFNTKRARRFTMLWNGLFSLLIAVLCSNNLGILWISLEATSLVSALLIMTDGHPSCIEAMWKYLLICSVGIALAFVGTLLLSVASINTSCPPHESLLWTSLIDRASALDSRIMCAAFIFILIGFGTKAGLAPMHTWLPDVNSQAPTPVTAVFSGVMHNCALYCIMRYLPLSEAAMGFNGRAHTMLIVFGLSSMMIAAIFIPSQKNIKRFLSYCCVEHIGIITLGLGLGGLGTFAALFHSFNHSIAKSLAFFSAGSLARQYDTSDMTKIKSTFAMNPLWGTGLLLSILALFGAAPFSIFISELLMVKTAIAQGKFVVLAIFFICLIIVFVSAIKRVISMTMGHAISTLTKKSFTVRDIALVSFLIFTMLFSGLCMPQWFSTLLKSAAAIVENSQDFAGFSQGLFR